MAVSSDKQPNARAEPRRLRLTCAVGSSAMLGGAVATLTLRNGSPDAREHENCCARIV